MPHARVKKVLASHRRPIRTQYHPIIHRRGSNCHWRRLQHTPRRRIHDQREQPQLHHHRRNNPQPRPGKRPRHPEQPKHQCHPQVHIATPPMFQRRNGCGHCHHPKAHGNRRLGVYVQQVNERGQGNDRAAAAKQPQHHAGSQPRENSRE